MQCQDFAVLWPESYPNIGCCQDCHTEESVGHIRLQPYALADGRSALVCCGGAFFIGWLRERAQSAVDLNLRPESAQQARGSG
jgi:hypothetical protein